ncbi:hypothetical protein N3K66_004278 [Trichothecium roseum]|uniref:Uncharacterized protein n=1 Tax=Trichothecium roseum TaxID=47278 RepID=A0ACC0V2L9_9HYPO|nr:hypothetical protein N3K66_004278 [Trichothecium roseum]
MLSPKSILVLAVAMTATPATAAETSCCFHLSTLADDLPLQQAPSGGTLHLGATSTSPPYPSLEYCFLSGSPAAVRDPGGNACYVDPRGQIICLDVTPGFAEWALGGEENLLSYDGETTFLACAGGVDEADGEVIWSVGGQGTGCREVKLQAKEKEGTC